MVSGEEIDITIDEEFRAGQDAPKTKEEIYSAMIVLGFLSYNDENSLSCVVNMAYLSARDTYRIEREEKSGKGYVDFSFHPRRINDIPFILELKKDDTPQNAIKQIREKEYVQKFQNEYKDRKILAVGICYNSDTKEHTCEIEEL